MNDTITAIATPPGRGGVAIIRLSGDNAANISQQICRDEHLPSSHQAKFAKFYDRDGQVIDYGYWLYFKSPNSFTGEEVVELHGHGGPVVMDMLLERAVQCGARLAQAGEFSQRAFLNDKMDLVQAEAVADLIDCSSKSAARLAMRSLQGAFSTEINQMIDNLIALRMYVEASLDFPEEEIDFLSDSKVVGDLKDIIAFVDSILQKAKQGAVIREGVQVVISGKPNAGKSTLINQLSGEDVAIVTDIPGTTRDMLRKDIDLDGLPIHLVDTAGLRESEDIVEREGVLRAHKAIAEADIVLLLLDAVDESDILDSINSFRRSHSEINQLITIVNKIDLLTEPKDSLDNVILLSAKTGEGVQALIHKIKNIVGLQNESHEGVFMARRRHLDALSRAYQHLQHGLNQLSQHRAGELLAEDLKYAQEALNEITGEFSADDLLGRIFSSFCIGK